MSRMTTHVAVLLVSLLSSLEAWSNENQPIVFADPLVKSICVEHWDTNGDGELSYAEAAAVTDLDGAFKQSEITSFEEFQYFTGLTTLYYAFSQCKNLQTIIMPEIAPESCCTAFMNCSNLSSIDLSRLNTSKVTNMSGMFEGCS